MLTTLIASITLSIGPFYPNQFRATNQGDRNVCSLTIQKRWSGLSFSSPWSVHKLENVFIPANGSAMLPTDGANKVRMVDYQYCEERTHAISGAQ